MEDNVNLDILSGTDAVATVSVANDVYVDYLNVGIASVGLLVGLVVAFCFGLGFSSGEK